MLYIDILYIKSMPKISIAHNLWCSHMKRWGLHTISNLWLLVSLSGGMVTPALAETEALSIAESRIIGLSTEAVLLAQSEGVLELGSTGSAVKDVQAMLSLMGYYSGAVDGTYGENTVAAVRQFQTDVGLTIDGVVGPATWRRLLPTPATFAELQEPNVSDETGSIVQDSSESPSTDASGEVALPETGGELPILKLDDSGSDVSRLQSRLAGLNFYAGPIDGVFGLQTEQAVEQFQRQTGLNVDGIVGPATWLELMR